MSDASADGGNAVARWWIRREPPARGRLIAGAAGFSLAVAAAATGASPISRAHLGAVGHGVAGALVATLATVAVQRAARRRARSLGYQPFTCRWARLRADESQRLLVAIRDGALAAGLRVRWHDRWGGVIAEGSMPFGPTRLRLRTRGADTNDGRAELSIALRRVAWLRPERAAALWTFGDSLVGGADVPVLAERDRPAPRRADRNAWAATMEPPE